MSTVESRKKRKGKEYGDKPWVVDISLKILKGHENKWGAITKQLKIESSSQQNEGE